MKILSLSFLFILLFSIDSNCQDNTVLVLQEEEYQYFMVGSSYYSTTYKGIKNYMTDLKQYQPEMHQELLPEFEYLKQKRIIGIGIAAGATALGSAFMFSSITKYSNNMDSATDHDNMMKETSGLFVGLGIIAIGGLMACIIYPSEDDFLSWVNHHNRINSKNTIQWRIGITYLPNNQIGGTLTMRF